MKKNMLYIGLAVIGGLLAGYLIFGNNSNSLLPLSAAAQGRTLTPALEAGEALGRCAHSAVLSRKSIYK